MCYKNHGIYVAYNVIINNFRHMIYSDFVTILLLLHVLPILDCAVTYPLGVRVLILYI